MSCGAKKDCFVVMPFGSKYVTEIKEQAQDPNAPPAKPEITFNLVDFDKIYREIIRPAAVAAELSCIRSDEISEAGNIQREMISRIIRADVVIVDITSQNANVFYELGIRHSFRRTTTVVIRRAGTHIPFNINGMRSVEYSDATPEDQDISRKRVTRAIKSSFQGKDVDSLIYTLFNDINVSRYAEPIMERRTEAWRIGGLSRERHVGFITGSIHNIKDVDAWVNAENTQLEMGRTHEDSVSAMIRYYGARRNSAGYVVEDVIGDALLSRKGDFWSVEPGMVISTPPGQLGPCNNVKAVLHVAALSGEPGRGYLPIRDHPGCVARALQEVDELNRNGLEQIVSVPCSNPGNRFRWFGQRNRSSPLEPRRIPVTIKSVLIPLFGTRSANAYPQDVADRLFHAAVVYFELHPDTELESIYFLASTTDDQLICESAIGSLGRANKQLFEQAAVTAPAPNTEHPRTNGKAPAALITAASLDDPNHEARRP
jgi:hypothetical protein